LIFLRTLKNYISAERVANYDEDKFESIFQEFDTDGNGMIEKSELAILIKRVFAVPKEARSKSRDKDSLGVL